MPAVKIQEPIITQLKATDNLLQYYCRYMNPLFFAVRIYFDDILFDTWEFLKQDEKDLMIINLPQGAGKSYFANLLISFLIGVDPTMSILRITNTQSFADNFTKMVSVDMNSLKYLNFFPHLPRFANDNMTEIRLQGNWNYSLRGAGADGTTMSVRTRFFVIDDLYKSFGEALSARNTKKIIQKWNTEWFGRKEYSGVKTLVVGTRYAKNDFYGYLEKEMDVFKKILIPALDENDKSFCEAVRTTQDLISTRRRMNVDEFNAIFQQAPSAEGQIIIFEDHEPIFIDTDNIKFDNYISVCDPSFGLGGDYFTAGIFGLHKKTVVLLKLFMERHIEYSDYFKFLKDNPCRYNYIEINGVGQQVVSEAYKSRTGIRFANFSSKGEKYNRVYAEKERIKQVVYAKDIREDAFAQLRGFPDYDFDDFPDMLAHATNIINNHYFTF